MPATDIEQRMEELLGQLRPYLETDKVSCTLDHIENQIAFLRMKSDFVGCPSILMTIRMGIERRIAEEFPELNGVHFL